MQSRFGKLFVAEAGMCILKVCVLIPNKEKGHLRKEEI